MEARDSFSIAPGAYASGRPRYPPELFAWIASMCHERRSAWDCATGNGQAAAGLAGWFERVEATDLSAAQLSQAQAVPNVRYSSQAAERTAFADASFDLVAVAQALHWFDFDRFWNEVRRVAAPGAFFAAWGYAWFKRTPELDEVFALYFDPLMARLESSWSPNNRLLWDGYRNESIGFPFERVAAPDFAIELEWDIERLIGYVRTWSAYKLAADDPATARSIEMLEQTARNRLAAHGRIRLVLPLAIAAGPIS